MILRLYPRFWLCRPFDRAIIVRALVTSSHKRDKGKPPSSRTFDLRVKLTASEGKGCDKFKQCDTLTQENTGPKVRVDRVVKRDPKFSLIKRLEKIDRVEEQDQDYLDATFKGDAEQSLPLNSKPSLTQGDTKVTPGESLLEQLELSRRVLTPVTMRIPEGLEKTIEVFRDFPDKYPFLRSERMMVTSMRLVYL